MSCYTCLKAKLEKKLSWAANADAAFTDNAPVIVPPPPPPPPPIGANVGICTGFDTANWVVVLSFDYTRAFELTRKRRIGDR